jgi:hypothetical protein
MQVFYMLPNLRNLNGRKRQDFFKGRIRFDGVSRFIEAEKALMRWLATADLVLDLLSMNPPINIRSLAAYFSERYSPSAYAQYCHEIRCQAENLRPDQYLKFLADLLTDKHQKISDLGFKLRLDQIELARRVAILAQIQGRNDLDADLVSFGELNDSLARLVESKVASPSRMSDILSMAGSRFGSQSVCHPHKKRADDRGTRSLIEGREAQEMMKDLFPPNPVSVVEEPPETEPGPEGEAQSRLAVEVAPGREVEGEVEQQMTEEEAIHGEKEELVAMVLPYPVRFLLSPRGLSRAFGIWKGRTSGVLGGSFSSVGDGSPGKAREAVSGDDKYSSLPLDDQRNRLRAGSDRHVLLRQIDFMRDINYLSRGRYVQIESEMEITKEFSAGSTFARQRDQCGYQ